MWNGRTKMATRLTKQVASIAAGATASLTAVDSDIKKLASSVNARSVVKVGLAGATVNTGVLVGFIGNEEIFRLPNGVTNTAGAPITQFDATMVDEPIGANESFDLQITNTSGGALQYYIYVEIEDLE
jgi:hypothetical protein